MSPAVRQNLEAALAAFPAAVRPLLRKLPDQAGRLWADDVAALGDAMGLPSRHLALALLPLASAFSRPEISGYPVGAAAVATVPDDTTDGNFEAHRAALFLGANLEFGGLPLYHTIHAEQVAVLNAWQSGAHRLQALAVSAPPCGVCRQFLVESADSTDLEILIPSAQDDCRSTHLSDLLPTAFGPADLKKSGGLFDRRSMGWHESGDCAPDDASPDDASPDDASFEASNDASVDPLVQAAMRAAIRSYAPYTNNRAGCALSLTDGNIISGRNLESVAFNPGLTALQAALALAALTGAELETDIQQIVLVERPTKVSQSAAAERFLSTWAPRIKLNSRFF